MKMWIAFLIPKIEDGNNFGVSVQVKYKKKVLKKSIKYRKSGVNIN